MTPTADAAQAELLAETPPANADARLMANAIRALAMDAVQAANSGHPGMPMGMADVATVLFTRFLKFDPATPDWPDRDRFVLSAGHGSMLLYALLHLTGYRALTMDQLRNFRQWGALTPGHPEYGHTPGIETTTGPLGQGLATAVGMALAERMLAARFGSDIVDHRTYVLCGDGCLMEGISHEAISLAGHLRLSKLIVLFDDNSISIDGPTSLSCSDDPIVRFAAAGWAAWTVDGHDPDDIAAALAAAQDSDRPSFIACRTIIGFGAPNKQGSKDTHGAPLGLAEIDAARDTLNWPHAPFEIPETVAAAWHMAGSRGAALQKAWRERTMLLPSSSRRHFEEATLGVTPVAAFEALDQLHLALHREQPKLATRQVSQRILNALVPVMPNLVGGSADLTSSNLTQAKGQPPVTASDFSGSYIHFGVREHGMAAALNGLALHGGFVPYGGTFLVFSDYSRPAIRLAALMRLRVIHVMTHDSIGLGEDGPTHQPVEHLASLRAIPNLLVLRPADAVETVEAWEVALESLHTPSILCLTRQAVPALPRPDGIKAGVARGAYVVHEPEGGREVTVIATGSEVALALTASRRLAELNIRAAVVSAPCFSLLARQPRDYQRAVLGDAPRIGVEAAIDSDWARWLGPGGIFIRMTGFGASAPAERLYAEFGITSEAVVRAALDLLETPTQRG